MKIKACPACGSTDITFDRTAGITGNKWKCRTCDYVGDIILETDIDKQAKE